ncbi:Methyltransferase domain-containing protein [Pedobacter steynii]|uniref:Methyltransferase domain-containing protein n=1 Tax=Pedobacter steynii TaxID=430522 RepID=A0A1G9JES0_9SPHI|nr:class I SAM-dependent methyltransferase [Pedobacter steynii]NQX38222.1 class I SAM-dependent methyltransferase [Pedobacter steynii]SDL35755.1 Methyltransferase domain-containing protein [Pedobacter steynii]
MSTKKEYTPALAFDYLTRFYDLAVKITMPENKFRTRLIDWLAPKSGETILEFGYGTAQNLIKIHRQNPNVKLSGLDIDPKVKAIAIKNMTKQGFILPLDLYDGKTFPYPDQSFDKVLSSLVFHHLDRGTKALCLKEIYRVLRPSGQLVIGDWGKPKSKLMRLLFYLVQLIDGFKTTSDNVNGLMPWLIGQAGFKQVTEADYINTKLGSYCYYQAEK